MIVVAVVVHVTKSKHLGIGDDPEHDLVEPNLMHSSDFDDNEEVLCDDAAAEECTFLFREDELEVDCDELHLVQ